MCYHQGMERNEISIHEVKIYKALAANADRWVTNQEVVETIDHVAPRTVRQTTKKLVELGLVEQAEVFPAHRFKLSEHAAQRNKGYLDRLNRAADVFGLPAA